MIIGYLDPWGEASIYPCKRRMLPDPSGSSVEQSYLLNEMLAYAVLVSAKPAYLNMCTFDPWGKPTPQNFYTRPGTLNPNPKAQMAQKPYIIWSLGPKALTYESSEP